MKNSLTSVQFRSEDLYPSDVTNEKDKPFRTMSIIAEKFGCTKFISDFNYSYYMFSTFPEAQAFYTEVKKDFEFIRISRD